MDSTKKEEKKPLLSEDAFDSRKTRYSTVNLDNDPVQRSRYVPDFRGRFPSFNPENRVTLSWHTINAFVKPEKKRFSFFRDFDTEKPKQLLRNVNGEVRPGQLLAIMGASGAGKTTLLNVLTCRNLRKLTVEGEVLVNGEVAGSRMTKISAYVQQDDLFIGTLKVREHLVFQALLRMDRHKTYSERMKRVEEVLVEMGLKKCADTVIGYPGRVKGISGGEMKRLAFASEVLTNPALMFCDEPTSGLDSFMSQNIVSVLKDMAAGGRTIICTIHQPSSEVYEMFDNLLLMAEGRVAYMGRANKALEFFERVGLRCPVNYNPADFFIQNLAIIPGKEKECREKIMKICKQFEKEESQKQRTISEVSYMPSNPLDKTRYKASWCQQFSVITKRSWLSMIREPMLTKVRLMQTLFIAVLLGLIYLNQVLDSKGIMNINGALFLVLINLTFQNVFSVINAFCAEQPIFLREHWNGMYRTDVYFLAKTLAEAPLITFMAAIFTIILYWMVGMNSQWQAFLICLGISILLANTAASFGYMISCMSSSTDVALSLGTPLLMPLLLFGGFYLNNATVPIYFIWVKYISWFYYGYESLIINQWATINSQTCGANSTTCPDGHEVINSLNFEEDFFLRDVGLIAVLLVFFRILAFIALLIRSSRRT